MDTDAKYLKRKVKAGSLDVHPTEKALVVNYELEATILGELGDPMLGEKKECQKIIRLKSLNPGTDVSSLAKEVIDKCKLIHPSKIPEVEQLLFYLQKRKELTSQTSACDDSLNSSDDYLLEDDEEDSESILANINDVEDYIELLYEDVGSKIKGSKLVLQLARNPDNLGELSNNETLLGALSRVLREEWKTSLKLTTNIVYIFFCLSTFSDFHHIISHYKIGSLVMDIVEGELTKYDSAVEDFKKNKKIWNEDKKFIGFLTKQNNALRVCIYLLLNISEDIKVEEKMRKKGIILSLSRLLYREDEQLLILVLSFLKKLSLYRENVIDFRSKTDTLSKFLPSPSKKSFTKKYSDDVIGATLRLMTNLSFDSECRAEMVKSGALQKIVFLITDPEHQNTALCILYHLSFDDKVKSMFTYTECIPNLMKLVLSEESKLEAMALGVNLAANKRNAQLICEGEGLKVLMKRAFENTDILVMKIVRNISKHEGVTKSLFIEFIGDVAKGVLNSDSEEFVLECLGILGNLTIPDLDYERLMKEYELVPWIKQKLLPIIQGTSDPEPDDLILEIVVFLGTCSSDSSAAEYICKSNLLQCLIELLKVKQEEDEIVLQIVYVFYQLCTHQRTKVKVINEEEAVAYLIDLIHDKNIEIQKVCDATLDLIGEADPSWAERVKREKFKFHNAQWLDIIQSQNDKVLSNDEEYEESDGDNDDFDEYIINDSLDLENINDLIISSGSSEELTIRNSRPTSSYKRSSLLIN